MFDAYRAGLVIEPDITDVEEQEDLPIHRRVVEEAVLDLVNERERGQGVKRIAA